MLKRIDENPILTPEDIPPTRDDLEVMCALNPGAVRFGEEILLLVRVGEKAPPKDDQHLAYVRYDPETKRTNVYQIRKDDPRLAPIDPRWFQMEGKRLLTSMSHLRIARSRDGVHFTVDEKPAIYPETPYETYGVEDARITFLEGQYMICYTAVSDRGVTVGMARTTDFVTFQRLGLIFPPYQKDVVLFPERIGGMYVCRHRPYMNDFNDACIWTARSPDLQCWGYHEMLFGPVRNTWEGGRVGAGGTPIKTDEGWLEIYHAADESGRYHLGAMLCDLEHPELLISRSRHPVFEPQADYELKGLYGNCVFTNGLIVDDDRTLTMYYGAADLICAAAVTTLDDMVDAALNK